MTGKEEDGKRGAQEGGELKGEGKRRVQLQVDNSMSHMYHICLI